MPTEAARHVAHLSYDNFVDGIPTGDIISHVRDDGMRLSALTWRLNHNRSIQETSITTLVLGTTNSGPVLLSLPRFFHNHSCFTSRPKRANDLRGMESPVVEI